MRLEKVLNNIKKYCSNELLDRTLLTQLNEINHFTSEWNVSGYIRSIEDNVPIIDKINVMMSYLYSNGVILIDNNICNRRNKPDFLSYLVRCQIITDEQEWVINRPWLDCTEIRSPYFS